MTCDAMVELTAEKGTEPALLEALRRDLPTTRANDRCQSLELTENMDDPDNFLIVMRWQSHRHYDTYLAWRESIRDVKRFADMAEGGLSIRFFSATDV